MRPAFDRGAATTWVDIANYQRLRTGIGKNEIMIYQVTESGFAEIKDGGLELDSRAVIGCGEGRHCRGKTGKQGQRQPTS